MPNTTNIASNEDEALFVERVKRAVLAGGGEFIGIQQSFDTLPMPGRCFAWGVVFRVPTNGIAAWVECPHRFDFSDSAFCEVVRKKIAESDKKFAERKTSVKVEDLVQMRQKVQEVLAALDAAIEGAKS